MNCYIGYLVTSTPPTSKYSCCLTQLNDYLQIQPFELIQTECLITLKYSSSSFTLPKNARYLHTSYYQIQIAGDKDWQFLQTCYECLMIIKQHMPSYIEITVHSDVEQLKEILDLIDKEKKIELTRRYTSQLKIIHQDVNIINQCTDIIYILSKQQHHKNVHLALKILNSPRIHSLHQIKPSEVDIIQSFAKQYQYKTLATEIINKIIHSKNHHQQNQNIINHNYSHNISYSQPIQFKSLLFQLKQSIKLQRVCFLLSKINLQDLSMKDCQKIDVCLREIGEKVANGLYSSHQSQFYQLYAKYCQERGSNESVLERIQKRIRSHEDIIQTHQQSPSHST